MHHYSQGKHTTQAHKGIPEGAFEEEQGRSGFFGPVSHLIKEQPSTRWTHIEGHLRPHLFDLVKYESKASQWQRLMYNSDCAIYYWKMNSTQTTEVLGRRNADGDSLFFCHKGNGQVYTEYGLLTYEPGTYVNMPKCVTYAIHAFEATEFLVIESKSSSYREPERGMVGRNAFYDLAALGKPDLQLMIDEMKKKNISPLTIDVKRCDENTRFSYATNIFDTIGWKGDFFPCTIHIRDMMPMLSARVHLPPSAHTTFAARGFVVCTFLPRPLETDADALKVPFYHQNIDYDEVLFYHDGNFFSRDNLHAGMMTLHPAGFPHGPHPKAVKSIDNKTHTDEVAVMIDTWQPLIVEKQLESVEIDNYWKSWMKS